MSLKPEILHVPLYFDELAALSRGAVLDSLAAYIREKGYDPTTVRQVRPSPDDMGYDVLVEPLPCYDVADVDY
jgi:hypothetical protein